MIEENGSELLHQARLDSWKSIAQHLDRSSRTVQRWHRKYGLPVRRLGVDVGSVFAYAEELDRWLQSRDESPKQISAEKFKIENHRNSQIEEKVSQQHHGPRVNLYSRKKQSAARVAEAYGLWEEVSAPNLRSVSRLFRDAIDLDPENAEAFAGLAHVLIMKDLMGTVRSPAAYVPAKAAVKRALELDATLPVANCGATWLKMVSDRDWSGALRGFDSVVNLRIPAMRAVVGRALLRIAERHPEEASEILREVVMHNPLNANNTALYCWSNYLAGDFKGALSLSEDAQASGCSGPVLDIVEALSSIHCERADTCLRRIEALMTDSPHTELLSGVLGYALALYGRTGEAKQILQTIALQAAGRRGEPYTVALVLLGLNEKYEAVQCLEQSYREGSLWSLGFLSDPALRTLRDQPSYASFLNKASYPSGQDGTLDSMEAGLVTNPGRDSRIRDDAA